MQMPAIKISIILLPNLDSIVRKITSWNLQEGISTLRRYFFFPWEWRLVGAGGRLINFSFIRSDQIVYDSLQPHESQHARPPCPSPTPGVHWLRKVFLFWKIWKTHRSGIYITIYTIYSIYIIYIYNIYILLYILYIVI